MTASVSFRAELEIFLGAHALQLRGLRRLAGGASQESWLVQVCDSNGEAERDLVLRRDMDGALSASARTRAEEFTLMQTVYCCGVPVPRVSYEPFHLEGHDAFFMDYVSGETIGRRIVRESSYAAARTLLPKQTMEALVTLHAIEPTVLPFLGAPQTPLDLVATLERDLDACSEGHPALELGLRWLRLHAPPLERPALVHGDFRMGNFIVGTDGLRAILDWELAHVGDPNEDLGWFCVRAWRFGCDEAAAGGLTTREQILQLYRAAGGHDVTMDQLRYWEIFGNVKWGIIALSQAGRHLHGNTQSVELAVLGRIAAEMELETLHLLADAGA